MPFTTYSLTKSHRILRQTYKSFRKYCKGLTSEQTQEVQDLLKNCQQAFEEKNRKEASQYAKNLEKFAKKNFKKKPWEHLRELVFAIVFALVVAAVVRQMWFEHYEVPTGSMRPTLEELDHLIVNKDVFSLNVPFAPKHLIFNPDDVQRNSIIVFTVEDMDVYDPDTMYFYLFPGKKRFIKRLMGKPGDTVYFYGGKIYAVDEDGNDLPVLRKDPATEKLEYIPFMNFDGEVVTAHEFVRGVYPVSILKHMNEPIAKLDGSNKKAITGEMLTGEGASFSQLWGMGNYAMVRLLTKDQVQKYSQASRRGVPESELYLELRHHPDVEQLQWGTDAYGNTRPFLRLQTTLIPLDNEHLQRLMDAMYTARFFVRNGEGAAYNMNKPYQVALPPKFPGVPDGCYEFYYGKAYEIKNGGMRFELPKDHPLYSQSHTNLQNLFNLGIQLSGLYSPRSKDQSLFPNRYAYYRNGDLYVLGAPIFQHGEPVLEAFIAREHEQEQSAKGNFSYSGFIDIGAPLLENGEIDTDKIMKYGLKIPENSYLALGDNHSVSGDSRIFGFVPGNNLRGSPSIVIWPVGKGWGVPAQPGYPWFTGPRLLIWLVLVLLYIVYRVVQNRKGKNFRIDFEEFGSKD